MTARMAETLETFFPKKKEKVLENPLIFGDFKNALEDSDVPRLYEDYKTYAFIKDIFEDVMLI